MTTVLLVEDHAGMREALVESMERIDGVTVGAAVGSAEEALDVFDRVDPDLVVVDLSLPGMSGAELVAQLCGTGAPVRCIVLSGHREPHYVRSATDAGACGYVLKGRPSEVRDAIAAVIGGGTWFSPALQLD